MKHGSSEEKDSEASSAFDAQGIVQQAIIRIKRNFGHDALIMADTCLCEYMSHGHCGVVLGHDVVNDPTLEILAKVAVSQAEAGADVVCPSDMMDGRVETIRWALDDAGLSHEIGRAHV